MPFASPVEFFVVGSVNGGIPQMRKNFSIKKGDNLVLYPVAVEDSTYYSLVDSFLYKDGTVKQVHAEPRKLKAVKKSRIRWFEVSPFLTEYDNLNPPEGERAIFWFAPIKYDVVFRQSCNLKKPLSFFEFKGEDILGTYYLTFRFDATGETLEQLDSHSFSDIKPVHRRYPYQVVQITVRSAETYMGYLTELFNTPFILSPKRLNTGDHQTDIRVGSDCAEFAIYGKRRQGYEVKYIGIKGIYRYLDEISVAPLQPGEDGVYTDNHLNVIETGEGGVEPGDIIHFGEHVSVFYRDAGFEGLLDMQDSILQSSIPTPVYTTLENSGFSELPIRVFKWKEKLEPIWENPFP